MDRLLTIISLALAVGSLVPSLTEKTTNTPITIMGTTASVILLLIILTHFWSIFIRKRNIDKMKKDINRMFSNNHPMSFEQVYAYLNYPDYDTASTAIVELLNSGSIHQKPIDVLSPSGSKYVVRVYNSINFPIP